MTDKTTSTSQSSRVIVLSRAEVLQIITAHLKITTKELKACTEITIYSEEQDESLELASLTIELVTKKSTGPVSRES